jgi:hypothetical protein
LHRIIDTAGTGKVAGSYLVPQGWTATDKLTWLPQDFLTPVVGVCKLSSPDGSMSFVTMSGLSLNYSHTPVGETGVRPPKTVCELLRQAWQKDHPNVKADVISQENGPVDRRSVGSISTFGYTGSLKLGFSQNGREFVWKGYARIDGFETRPAQTALGGATYDGWWVISHSMAVTAQKDKYDEAMKLCGIVLASSTVDPHFFNVVQQVQEMIRKNFFAKQRMIAKTSELIARTSDEMSEARMRQYHDSEKASDKENENFDDYIRDVDKYNDGNNQVKLPTGYPCAWSDGNGGYIVSEDRLYNPNVGGSGDWHQIERAPGS